MTDEKTQLDKFKEGARDFETDDDPERFKEQLAKLVEHKPVEIRDAGGLEAEADAMGARALKHKPAPEKPE